MSTSKAISHLTAVFRADRLEGQSERRLVRTPSLQLWPLALVPKPPRLSKFRSFLATNTARQGSRCQSRHPLLWKSCKVPAGQSLLDRPAFQDHPCQPHRPHHPKAFHHTPVLPTQASLTLLLFLECTLVNSPSLTFKIPLVSPGRFLFQQPSSLV